MTFKISFVIDIIVVIIIISSIHSHEQLSNYVGIINHRTQWHMDCPSIDTIDIVDPAILDEQTSIVYQCPLSLSIMTIVPIELDLTFLCRSSSRLLWIIVDLYQYDRSHLNGTSSTMDVDVTLDINRYIRLNDSKHDVHYYRSHSISIYAFYIPFESIDIGRTDPIDIRLRIQHRFRLNQCQLELNDSLTWANMIEHQCQTEQARTLTVRHARCDFSVE
jgi:hypothetical protein